MKNKKRQNRRDRRKAKASGWKREGTTKAKRANHHAYDPVGMPVKTPFVLKPKKGTKDDN